MATAAAGVVLHILNGEQRCDVVQREGHSRLHNPNALIPARGSCRVVFAVAGNTFLMIQQRRVSSEEL